MMSHTQIEPNLGPLKQGIIGFQQQKDPFLLGEL